jgi:NAD(P)-dependent dehydrogenase (short-subunit alcohol dehydrogenase family)
MRIGIIGAGNMGAALAAQLTRLGHQVAIASSRGPRTLAGVAARQALADANPEQTASWRSQHPQHAKPNTAVHASSRTGVRFVLVNPSDPSRLDEFTNWYDTYSAAITVPGYLANNVHFENPDASGENSSPRYATIYDIVSPDPATAWPDTEHSPAYPADLFSDPRAKLVSPALRASYALVGSQLQPGQHGPLTGIHVILSNGGGDTERQHREAQILQTGLFYSAARFRIIEGSPDPAEWLEIFETDHPDPLHAYPRATSNTPPAPQIQPRLSQSFHLAGTPQNQSRVS